MADRTQGEGRVQAGRLAVEQPRERHHAWLSGRQQAQRMEMSQSRSLRIAVSSLAEVTAWDMAVGYRRLCGTLLWS